MANLKVLRRRIKSIKGTSQITKAMELVAAAKMKKAQDKAQKGIPYLDQLQKVLGKLSKRVDPKLNPLLSDSKGTKTGVLLITTNKGLCGSINTNLLKFVSNTYDKEKTVFYTIGRKGRTFLAKTGRDLKADFEVSDSPEIIETNSVGKLLTDDFLDDKINKIEIVYSHFINTAIQKATKFDLLPLSALPAPETTEDEVDYEYEPNAQEILAGILPHYISYTIYQLILESRASEHSSRMVAMKNATDNAKEIIKELTLQYNKARQALITNQILEISSAAAAMEK
ncbi:MAG: ATP synthase F1 subunit gamma [Planctomycetota bacterium]|nr:MAG: ATP synthase F1 subunit gamma [Planctomycetota bacterium]